MKTEALKQALDAHGFDVIFGGARRDEEASRAKERVCSFRAAGHRWDPKAQRPELWSIYNLRDPARRDASACSRCRTGPSSTSGHYIEREDIPIVPLYFAEERPVVERGGTLHHGGRRSVAARAGRAARCGAWCGSARSAAIR